mmetsp:Transcript_7314/g.15937  ORF Transcript_7314/g.15937 Transcript_7314/m.15937 type:complete len:332 (+) Transcript_7314:1211-2206(+)
MKHGDHEIISTINIIQFELTLSRLSRVFFHPEIQLGHNGNIRIGMQIHLLVERKQTIIHEGRLAKVGSPIPILLKPQLRRNVHHDIVPLQHFVILVQNGNSQEVRRRHHRMLPNLLRQVDHVLPPKAIVRRSHAKRHHVRRIPRQIPLHPVRHRRQSRIVLDEYLHVLRVVAALEGAVLLRQERLDVGESRGGDAEFLRYGREDERRGRRDLRSGPIEPPVLGEVSLVGVVEEFGGVHVHFVEVGFPAGFGVTASTFGEFVGDQSRRVGGRLGQSVFHPSYHYVVARRSGPEHFGSCIADNVLNAVSAERTEDVGRSSTVGEVPLPGLDDG